MTLCKLLKVWCMRLPGSLSNWSSQTVANFNKAQSGTKKRKGWVYWRKVCRAKGVWGFAWGNFSNSLRGQVVSLQCVKTGIYCLLIVLDSRPTRHGWALTQVWEHLYYHLCHTTCGERKWVGTSCLKSQRPSMS